MQNDPNFFKSHQKQFERLCEFHSWKIETTRTWAVAFEPTILETRPFHKWPQLPYSIVPLLQFQLLRRHRRAFIMSLQIGPIQDIIGWEL